jgi:hypothetical protein
MTKKLLRPVALLLSEEQEAAVAPFMTQLAVWDKEGKPGMLLAQVFGDHMVVGIIPHEKAIAVSTASGSNGTNIVRHAGDVPSLGWHDDDATPH